MIPSRRGFARGGFTLMELLVTVLIIGILAAFAVPQYMKALETSKADDAAALSKMIATTNRMYALDRNGVYAAGNITNACNTASCTGGSATDPCKLVACKYLAAQNWDSKAYVATAANAAAAATSSCGGGGFLSSRQYAGCVNRRTGASPGTNSAPYNTWGYATDVNGVTEIRSGTPLPAE